MGSFSAAPGSPPLNYLGGVPLVPVASNFTLLQGTNVGGLGTLTDLFSRGVALRCPNTVPSSVNICLAERNVPNTTSFTILACFHPNGPQFGSGTGTSWEFGLYVKDATGKITCFSLGSAGGINSLTQNSKWTNINTLSSRSFLSGFTSQAFLPQWHRLVLSGANFTWSVSMDGEFFFDIAVVAKTNFIGTPDKCGFMVNNAASSANKAINLNCYSYVQQAS